MEEKQDFFVRAGQIDNEDELLDELDQLEADLAAEDLEGMEVGMGSVEPVHAPEQKVPTGKAKVQSEEDELRALE